MPTRFVSPEVIECPLCSGEGERHGLQLVHDPRARLHHAVPVPQQLPQITIFPARYPDLREAIFQQQLQNQLRIPAIRFLGGTNRI